MRINELSTEQLQPRYHTKFSQPRYHAKLSVTVNGDIYDHQLLEFSNRSWILDVKRVRDVFTNLFVIFYHCFLCWHIRREIAIHNFYSTILQFTSEFFPLRCLRPLASN